MERGLWVASYNGLLRYDAQSNKHYELSEVQLENMFTNNKIMSIQIEGENIWVGYRASGLELYSTSTGATRKYNTESKPSLSSNSISRILTTSDGKTYIGTHGGGINVLSKDGLVNTHLLGNERIVMLFEASDETIWVGTESKLIFLPKSSDRFLEVSLNPMGNLFQTQPLAWTIGESSSGDLWFGTMHHGLFYWPKESRYSRNFSGVTPVLGRDTPISTIYAIEVDHLGSIWCSTNRGLVRVNANTKEYEIFNEQHGIMETEFDHGVSHRSDQGLLYFGGSNGYIRFNPSDVVTNIPSPRLHLNHLSLPHNSLLYPIATKNNRKVTLSYKDYFVTFAFSVLDFIDPDKNQFRYMLENFDADWIDNETRNTATYTSLPAGRYTFRVQGANSAGVWNREGISLDVEVLPPPWHSWCIFSGKLNTNSCPT